jgi:hypothetical protein
MADLEKLLEVAKTLGVPIKDEKSVPPTTCIIFLGLELDSLQMEIRLPEEKLRKIRALLQEFLLKKKATLLELQSLIGLLNATTKKSSNTCTQSCTPNLFIVIQCKAVLNCSNKLHE